MENDKLTARAVAFLLRSKVDYSLSDLYIYLNDSCKTIDCLAIKKKYITVQPNGADLNKVLSKYIIKKFHSSIESDAEIPDDIDMNSMIENNIDIFFDITDSDDDTIFIEYAE